MDIHEMTVTLGTRIACRDSISDLVIAAQEQGLSIHIDTGASPLGQGLIFISVEKTDAQTRSYKKMALHVHDILPEH